MANKKQGKVAPPGQPFKAPSGAGVNGNPKNSHPIPNTRGDKKIRGL